MKKFFCTFFLCMLTAVTLTVSARAGEDIIKVGLYYGDKALYSANLQNDAGHRGYLENEKISMTAGGTIYLSGGAYSASRPDKVDGVIGGYHVQLEEVFPSFEEAAYAASQLPGSFPAFINNQYRVHGGSGLAALPPGRMRRPLPPPTPPRFGRTAMA